MGPWEVAGVLCLAAMLLAPFAAIFVLEVCRTSCLRCRRRLRRGRADKDGRGEVGLLCGGCGRWRALPPPD